MSDRRVSESEMSRRQRVANLRTHLAGVMAGHEERSIDIWQAALLGLLGRLSEWALEDEDHDDMTSDPSELSTDLGDGP
jgi:hypothetical protein